MRLFIVETITHLLVWLRDGSHIECWLARTAAGDALRRGCSVLSAIRRGVAAGTDLQDRRHGR